MTSRPLPEPADAPLRGKEIECLDLLDGGVPERTSAYLVLAPRPALVESGGTLSQPQVLAALERAGLSPDDVAFIAVTHVHLDHAGGAAALTRLLSRAKVVVHARGAPHLVDPARLVEGSRLVYGDGWEARFGPVEPLDPDRLLVPAAGQVLDLGGGHELVCLDTPGHCFHHLAFYDRGARVLFPGDVMGMRYTAFSTPVDPYVLPSTAPNQFDPDVMAQSCAELARLPAEVVAFSHFGPARVDLDWLAARVAHGARGHVDAARPIADQGREAVARALVDWIRGDFESSGRSWDGDAERALRTDIHINAGGVEAYLRYLARDAGRGGD